ncbi:hypothetical protein MML48_6g00019044 [Holotrichia oblita]|uniref:Uncharacterized protein n=4 Tax=Holotrichia oblita TaxID=644536 RepID=A0ACB9SYD4_HOLOL|nr:hypothetical protein MML48_6g00011921 [Holotrichia oblita]KAI4459583.1 hypothetical protein MML48_6g00008912 [Holotrichia oblita]KAI4459584.1 hypothetical protein MML48_6g00021243 [Holotrichia oblita]KAI4459586.1 hypothetical protein MML48_6g00019044 [Holotrichia oblita]
MKRFGDIMDDDLSLCKKASLVESSSLLNNLSLNQLNYSKSSRSDLVQLAKEIQKADTFVHANACNKLQVIAEQIRFLQTQAEKILLETKRNTDLHHAACNFVKVPGNIYHLYQRSSGQKYFGMLSPQEWQTPHEYLGSFRLEHDQSWTAAEYTEEKDNQLQLLDKVLAHNDGISACKRIQDIDMEM